MRVRQAPFYVRDLHRSTDPNVAERGRTHADETEDEPTRGRCLTETFALGGVGRCDEPDFIAQVRLPRHPRSRRRPAWASSAKGTADLRPSITKRVALYAQKIIWRL
jgi:hypothetical protein